MTIQNLKADAIANRTTAENVLVIYDTDSAASEAVARYYAQERGITDAQLFGFSVSFLEASTGIHRSPNPAKAKQFIDELYDFIIFRTKQGWHFSAAFFIGEWPYRMTGQSSDRAWLALALFGLGKWYDTGQIEGLFDGSGSLSNTSLQIGDGAFEYLNIDGNREQLQRYGAEVRSLRTTVDELSEFYVSRNAGALSLVATFLPLGEGDFRDSATAQAFGIAYVDRVIASEGRTDWGEVWLAPASDTGHFEPFLAAARLWHYPLDNVFWSGRADGAGLQNDAEHLLDGLAVTKNPVGVDISQRTNTAGFSAKYANPVFFHHLGTAAYYGHSTEPYTPEWLDYEPGAIVVAPQSFGGGHVDPLDFPGWDFVIVPDDRAEVAHTTRPTFNGGKVEVFEFTTAAANARYSVTSGVMTIQDDSGTNLNIDFNGLTVLEGFRAVVGAIPATWQAALIDSAVMGRAFDAITYGAAFAQGAMYEPLSNNDAEAVNFFIPLSLGGTIADAARLYTATRKHRDQLRLGDPLYCPFPNGLGHFGDTPSNSADLGPVFTRYQTSRIDAKAAAYRVNGGAWLSQKSTFSAGDQIEARRTGDAPGIVGFGLNQIHIEENEMALKTFAIVELVENGNYRLAGFCANEYVASGSLLGKITGGGFGFALMGFGVASLFGNVSLQAYFAQTGNILGTFTNPSAVPIKSLKLYDSNNIADVIAGGETVLIDLVEADFAAGAVSTAPMDGTGHDDLLDYIDSSESISVQRFTVGSALSQTSFAQPPVGTYVLEIEIDPDVYENFDELAELPAFPSVSQFDPNKLKTDVKSVAVYLASGNEFAVKFTYDGKGIDLEVFDRFLVYGLTTQPIDTDTSTGAVRPDGSTLVFDVGTLATATTLQALRVVGFNDTEFTSGVTLIDSNIKQANVTAKLVSLGG